MKEQHTDIAIIGAGTAGLSAWGSARRQTDSVVLIEGGPYGTTCARVGCMPSKLLIAAADAAQHARHTEQFGVHAGPVSVDGKAVMARVRRMRDDFVGGVLESVERIDPKARFEGHARFEDANTLIIGEHTRLKAERIIIATGSRPTWPDFFESAGDRLISNDDLFYWDTLPESVAVFGPGIIGLELSQALHRLGVRVRVFGASGGVGPFEDDALRSLADDIFNEEFYLDPAAKVDAIERDGDRVQVRFRERHTGKELDESFDYLLAATGRRPNVDSLDLQNADLALDDRGVPHFNRYTLQCQNTDGNPGHIFIVGDANQELPLLHVANQQGRTAGSNAASYPEVQANQPQVPLSIIFTDPQIAVIGGTRKQLQQAHGEDSVASGEISLEDQGRAKVIGRNQGLVRVYGAHGSGDFLGAELLGPEMEHIGHLLAWALQQKQTVGQMLEMPFYHPVLEEGLRSALRDLQKQLQQGPAMEDSCLECGPGA